ncbi:MAG: L,D-transpeptidase family protein [Deltaproteobacteria bacterium]|nr:L,D-transpeptidase family protein [Deltaproteobacteria bacterium]MCB9788082.1 L,D-transpeptidase family protein [Deltaproteobacteria bacterium]
MRRRSSLLILCAAAYTAACGDDTPPPAVSASRVESPANPSAAAEATPDAPAAAEAVEAPAAVSRGALARRLRGLNERWTQRERALLEAYKSDFQKALDNEVWFKKLRGRLYEARGYALLFSDGETVRPQATALLEALDGLESQGLDPEPYRREALRESVAAVDRARAAYDAVVAAPLDARDTALWDVAERTRKSMAADVRVIEAALASTELSDEDLPRVVDAEARLDRIFEAREALNGSLRDLDIALLGRWFRYAYDMRFARRVHPFSADKDDAAGVTRTADALYELTAAVDFDHLDEALAALVPQHPDYPKLVAGLAFYRGLAEAGDQPELGSRADRLRKGSKGPLVEALQKRLVQEGYLEGEPDGHYGDALVEAVRFYQETHQLKETGAMDDGTRRSMDKPYAERAAQVVLALQRFRESDLHQGPIRFGESELQARINIPGFEAVFFRNGEPVRRHQVVVGNNAIETDEATGLRGYFNRTRMFSAEMQTVVLNPTWKVPPRIKEQELDRELLEQPDFYERHNYKVTVLPNGTEEVVQLPGPDNALGLVKFLFPNDFSIYMHDTPKKHLFGRELRAFSHGCMRTKDALDLARWLLCDVQGLEPARFDRILESREEYGIALTKKVAITIDYSTVGVHSSGKLMFYADIYRFDRDLEAGKTPYPPAPVANLEQAVILP